jgi:hypothetical protein
MGIEEPQLLTMVDGLWAQNQRVSNAENLEMAISFTAQELDEVLALTKTETAPGPDGFPVIFFRTAWSWLKPLILAIPNEFALGRLDISRLNFGGLISDPQSAWG